MPIFLAIYIGVSNDRNGNPRRGWYVSRLDDQHIGTAFVEEGYQGWDALYMAVLPPTAADENTNGSRKSTWRDRARAMVYETGAIEVSPREFQGARRMKVRIQHPA